MSFITHVLVLGARQYAPVFADVFGADPSHKIVGFVENLERSYCTQPLLGMPVYWIADIATLASDHLAICCLATPKRRGFVAQVADLGFGFATLVHPTAWVSQHSTLGAGVSVDVGVIIAGFTHVGDHTRIGRGVTIGHHTQIGGFVTLHPRCNIAGNCTIGEGVTVGMGANIIDGTAVGAGATIAAGAVVTRDVPARALAGGVPAKVIRENYEAA